jgi:hypothetical protein
VPTEASMPSQGEVTQAQAKGSPPPAQKFAHAGLSRTRFAWPSRVWARFQAAADGTADLTVRAVSAGSVPRCIKEPSTCRLVGHDKRQVQAGLNRISLNGLLGRTPRPGHYLLRVTSRGDGASLDLSFWIVATQQRRGR